MVSGLPKNSVRTAIRLPLKQQTNGKSIVLVELDTEQHEDFILKQRNILRGGSLNNSQDKNVQASTNNQKTNINDKFLFQKWKNLGVRRAKFKELWKFVEELAVVKRVTNVPIEDTPEYTDPNKIDANTFLFGTEAAASLAVIDNKKESNKNTFPSPPPSQIVVRKQKPLNAFKGMGEKDLKSNKGR